MKNIIPRFKPNKPITDGEEAVALNNKLEDGIPPFLKRSANGDGAKADNEPAAEVTEPDSHIVAEPVASEKIPFTIAVRRGKEIVQQVERSPMLLGELAARCDPVYGKGTIKRLAAAIGANCRTLERYRDVYRAWASIRAPERESLTFAVAKELETHPDRFNIVKQNPNMTRAEAAKIRRDYDQNANDHATDDDEHKWQEGLRLRLTEAIKKIKLNTHWTLPDPPDAGLVKLADDFAKAATELARYLRWAHENPEELAEARDKEAKGDA